MKFILDNNLHTINSTTTIEPSARERAKLKNSPLEIATKHGHLHIVELLFSYKKKPTQYFINSAINIATERKYIEILEFLLLHFKKDEILTELILFSALKIKDFEYFDFLIKKFNFNCDEWCLGKMLNKENSFKINKELLERGAIFNKFITGDDVLFGLQPATCR